MNPKYKEAEQLMEKAKNMKLVFNLPKSNNRHTLSYIPGELLIDDIHKMTYDTFIYHFYPEYKTLEEIIGG